MDLSSSQAAPESSLAVDAGYMLVTDTSVVDDGRYQTDLENYILEGTRDGVQALLTSLFQLPSQASSDGPLALLPPPITQLPRSKPLPKPKPLTKWEKFAAAKGIQKRRKDKKIWDDDKQDWVNRWGRDGKNKVLEDQWLTEVAANADVDFNPSSDARSKRKERMSKNEKQRQQNMEQATQTPRLRSSEIEKTLASARTSTASMGKFDKVLEGEKKLRGVKRKFNPTEAPVANEKKAALALISKLDSGSSKTEKSQKSVLNVRKAIRSNGPSKTSRHSTKSSKSRK